MMTIKAFAQLCNCSSQTLRYYDKIALLKPAAVDPWTGYRRYDPAQAVDFVKIKNLQAADFTIEEIKVLLTQPDSQVFAAFDRKIAEQVQKLERIRKIQKSYLAEKNTMEQIVYSMTDYLLSQCRHPEVLTEFGWKPEDAPAILARLRKYLNSNLHQDIPPDQVTMTVNNEVIQGQEAVLERIRSFTKETLEDTVLLNDGFGHALEHSAQQDPDFSSYEVIWEQRNWAHVSDFLHSMPPLEPGKIYCLRLQTHHTAGSDDLSFAMFLLGAVLHLQQREDLVINCSVTAEEGRENHFKLLCRNP